MKTPPIVKPSIDRWIEWRVFQSSHKNIFATPQSFDWFIRRYQPELRRLGLVAKITNVRRVDGPAMEAFIEQLAQDSMAEAAA